MLIKKIKKMKKLQKLTLKELEKESHVLKLSECSSLTGGDPEDNDCVVDVLNYFGISDECFWTSFGQTYGLPATVDAINNGVNPENGMWMATSLLSGVSNISNCNDIDTALANGKDVAVTVNTGVSLHAMIVLSCSGSGYEVMDGETFQTSIVDPSDLDFSFAFAK